MESIELLSNIALLQQWQFWVGTLIFSVFAYLMGSINTGHIISRIWKKDLGEVGSGNYGSTNAGRIHGVQGFAIVFLTDMSKGIIVGIILGLLHQSQQLAIFSNASISIALVFVIVGHMWPVYFKFKGGKGIAAGFGVFITINWVLALGLLGIFLISLPFTTRISLSSSLVALSIMIMAPLHAFIPEELLFNFATDSQGIGGTDITDAMLAMYLSGTLIILKHIPNYIQVIKREHMGSPGLRMARYKIFHPFSKQFPEHLIEAKRAKKAADAEIKKNR